MKWLKKYIIGKNNFSVEFLYDRIRDICYLIYPEEKVNDLDFRNKINNLAENIYVVLVLIAIVLIFYFGKRLLSI